MRLCSIARPRFALRGIAVALPLLLVLGGAEAVGAASWHPRPELLVRAPWLAAHLREATQPGLRIVDVRDAAAYAQGHIPGAVNLPAEELFATVKGVAGMLPPVAQVAEALSRAGIGAGTTVVAYDDAGDLYAARLFWVLDYLGQGHGRLLDGGWRAWLRGGRSVSREAFSAPYAAFTPRPKSAAIADLAWVRAHLHDPAVVLVDARSTLEYIGATRYAKHGGHIPGAVSMEWKRNLRPDGTFRSAAELRETYEQLGVMPDREAVVYCQVLVRAAHTYFTLKWLGLPRVRGYDGSWAEWGNRDDTPKALL
ncbi:MAG TPA: sulfurtransferase [bacterium]|nr:sulfurtransferase [bacterium]